MKVRSVGISNIRSFGLDPDFENKIELDENSPNVLIGPNGSGKSTFLEVLARVFSNFFFVHASFDLGSGNSWRQEIRIQSDIVNTLPPNKKTKTDRQRIYLKLIPDRQDRENILWLQSHAEDLDTIGQAYGRPVAIPKNDLPDEVEVTLGIMTSDGVKRFAMEKVSEGGDEFVTYLVQYEIINCLISLKNLISDKTSDLGRTFESEVAELSDSSYWNPLRPSLSLVEPDRNYNHASLSFEFGDRNQRVTGERNIRHAMNSSSVYSAGNGEPTEFAYLKTLLAQKAVDLLGPYDVPAVLERVNNDTHLIALNRLLENGLGGSLKLKFFNNVERTFRLELKINGEVVDDVSDLSSGQRALLFLAVKLVVFDNRSGILLIDEPESHLHPRLQRKLLEMIYSTTGRQVVLVTHSPIFVTEKTMANVRRFYIDSEGMTSTITHSGSVKKKKLLNFLSYTNSARIFFSRKVILVEGQDDSYFLGGNLDRKYPNEDTEILNIGGKGNQADWRVFLEGWGIEVCFFGDYDNVLEFRIASDNQFVQADKNNSDLRTDANKTLQDYDAWKKNDSTDNKARFEAAMESLRQAKKPRVSPEQLINQDERMGISERIEAKYDSGIFILKLGDIEVYTGKSKGIEYIVEFCDEGFNFSSVEAQKEIDNILEKIVGKK